MVVYVDIVFLTNFVLDFALLLATARIRKIRPSAWRLILASMIGASYVLMMFVPELAIFYTFVVKCLFSAAMIMTAFGYKTLGRFAGTLAAFYGVNFAAAGTVFAVHYMARSSSEVVNGIVFSQTGGAMRGTGMSLWYILVMAGLGIWLFRVVHSGAKRKETKAQFLTEVEVRIEGTTINCQGLIDTGNHLYDPLTRTPVMVMEASLWSPHVPQQWLDAIRSGEADSIVGRMGGESEEAFPWPERIRLVPYRGINGRTKFMLAMKPDEVAIMQDGRRIAVDKVLIGLDGGQLSSEGAYRAIVHPALVS
ncbi:sigma-E processing peptidase SpoIIGA [Paenibacillus thermotolerans]|uniref:sigma-E processing peptidase SpoIIGA n=1 Tax=Paenibacillus thermotolerans TaxID=3027807 RepID=UPI0023687C7E|nr:MULTISPECIES: sigma-E processing peptidase SpoIIGA [unclassified Paenibacillus]